MKELFLSLIFFSIIITILSLIVPNGRMKKSSMCAISFIVSLIMVNFFVSFANGDIKYEETTYEENEMKYQEKILVFVCDSYLKENGINSELISIELSEDNYVFTIKKISIKNPQNELGEYSEKEVTEKLCNYFNVEKEQIYVYE